MGFVRSFPTTFRRSNQTLFETFIPPLDRRKKNLVLNRGKVKMEPTYNGALNEDLAGVLKIFRATPQRDSERIQILKQVTALVRELKGGVDCDIVDVSMDRYACSIHDAPFEFIIVDKNRPNGSPPDSDVNDLPDIYNPSTVAKALVAAGYAGSFICSPVDTLSFLASKTFEEAPRHSHKIPWPHYVHKPRGEILCPPRIQVDSPFPFILTLPGPTLTPLIHFLQDNYQATPYRELLGAFYIWQRSHGFTEFTPAALALMTLRFIQDEIVRVSLHSQLSTELPSDSSSRDSATGVWVVQEYTDTLKGTPSRWRTVPVWLNVSYGQILQPKLDKKVAPMLYKLLKYWGDRTAITKTHILSAHRPNSKRQYVYTRASNINPKYKYILAHPGDLVPQPEMWRHQRLVIQDPFIPTLNHAESVSAVTYHYFSQTAQVGASALFHSSPFTAIIGRYFDPPRRQCNLTSLNREFHTSPLSHTLDIGEIQRSMETPIAVIRQRSATIRKVQDAIQRAYSRKYKVELFGSVRYGISSPTSDLDLVIIDPERVNGFAPGVKLHDLPAIYNVRKLAKVLQQAGFRKVISIPKASVPIVKFTDTYTGLDCDINVNDQLGLINTALLKSYCDLSPLLRTMMICIKRWAKPLGLNNPSGRGGIVTFSSYALTLMTIAFLQSRQLLPNLQSGLPELPRDATEGIFWLRTKTGDRIRCDIRYNAVEGWVQPPYISLDQVILEWFTYWGSDHKSEIVVSIREGGLVSRDDIIQGKEVWATEADEPGASTILLQPTNVAEDVDSAVEDVLDGVTSVVNMLNKSTVLCVIDPFIRVKNVTGNINTSGLLRFQRECQRVLRMVAWGEPLNGILSQVDYDGVKDWGKERRNGNERSYGKERGKSKGAGQVKPISGSRIQLNSSPLADLTAKVGPSSQNTTISHGEQLSQISVRRDKGIDKDERSDETSSGLKKR